ncbi:MAG: PQQ-dependent sugar dehydrogenase, partial [Actinomycetota bacterium]
IDTDGWLWATYGDDYVGTHPQDPATVHGKVLRLDRFSGEGHPDNPFAAGGGDGRIYSLGHRNPQGITFHPVTGRPWVVEHGSDVDDEINQVIAGGNYGWDPAGNVDSTGTRPYVEIRTPMTDPAIAGARTAWWSSGRPTVAPGGLAFLVGDQWGAHEGAVIMPTLKDMRLHLFTQAADGGLGGHATVPALEGTHGRLRQATMGPDGALYLTTSNSGFGDADLRRDRILRVVPVGYEPPPVGGEPSPPVDGPSAPEPPAGPGSELVVRAIGQTGEERLAIVIDGVEVDRVTLRRTNGSFWSTTDWHEVRYRHPSALAASQVRLVFANNGTSADGGDRNVRVDHIRIDGQVFETEGPDVVSSGSWGRGSRCSTGSFGNDNLACNGYIQYHGPYHGESPSAASTVTIATLGDSNTASGYWRRPFQERLLDADCRFDMVGGTAVHWGGVDFAGFDADTDARSGAYVDASRSPANAVFTHAMATLDAGPDLVIVIGGTNDLLGLDLDEPDDERRLRQVVAALADELRDAARRAPGSTFHVVAIAQLRGQAAEVEAYNAALASMVADLATELDVAFVPASTTTADLGPDGVHFTVEGAARYGRTIAEAVVEGLRREGACAVGGP